MNIAPLVAALGAALAAGCGGGSDPKAEIRALIAAAEQAAEARDAGFFGDLLGEGYRDALANQRIEIVSRVDEIVLEGGDAARAVVHAGLLGRRAGAQLLEGVDADLYRFELELVSESGEWRIIGASWRRALGE
jgi:hypothetical protein